MTADLRTFSAKHATKSLWLHRAIEVWARGKKPLANARRFLQDKRGKQSPIRLCSQKQSSSSVEIDAEPTTLQSTDSQASDRREVSLFEICFWRRERCDAMLNPQAGLSAQVKLKLQSRPAVAKPITVMAPTMSMRGICRITPDNLRHFFVVLILQYVPPKRRAYGCFRPRDLNQRVLRPVKTSDVLSPRTVGIIGDNYDYLDCCY